MCLAVPGKVIRIEEDGQGVVDFLGVQKKVALDLLAKVEEGDYVIVHAGFAITRLDQEAAHETLAYLRELGA